MSVLMIGFDLNREGANYARKNRQLHEYIRSSFDGWWNQLDSTYLVCTDRTPYDVTSELVTLLDNNDEILVARIGRDTAWGSGFSEEAKEWLRVHLPR